ncbi:MAG: hypothetical protein GJ680_14970 [Alteromonadaceae bacterium]|nr:hypothetical protein [Alteromonadaceae bacterium]
MLKLLSIFSVFLGAFLSFQIQPMLGKLMLPHFGGAASVWLASMMFFQSVLFLGYLYAYGLTKMVKQRRQWLIHSSMLVVALLTGGGLDNQMPLIDTASAPLVNVVVALWQKVGLLFLLLAANGVLVQHWLVTSKQLSSQFSKHWYAWSNAGAMLALLSYPVFFEPRFALLLQLDFWKLLFSGFVLAVIALVFYLSKATHQHDLNQSASNKTRFNVFWIILPMLGVTMLMSTTAMMTQNIPSMPLMWIAPLVIYLLSYILTFAKSARLLNEYQVPFTIFVVVSAMLMFAVGSWFSFSLQVVVYLTILLLGCVLCHGKLAEIAPDNSLGISSFYLCISFGGLLGGIVVTILAPLLFTETLEYPLVFILLASCLCVLQGKQVGKWQAPKLSNTRLNLQRFVLASLAVVALFGTFYLNQLQLRYEVAAERNFYGKVSIRDIELDNGDIERRIVDGSTVHGWQRFKKSTGKMRPISFDEGGLDGLYYQQGTGIELAFRQIKHLPHANIAVIGLGAGVLSSFGKAGDNMTFFELNPNVIDFAHSHFSYLADSQADVSVIPGDARVNLSRKAKAREFDLFVIDAFTSDAIPAHLLTFEAFELYQQHTSEEGILAIHVSNSHLDLTRVIQQHAQALSLEALLFRHLPENGGLASDWVLVAPSNKLAMLKQLSGLGYLALNQQSGLDEEVIWRDQHHSLFSLLKI